MHIIDYSHFSVLKQCIWIYLRGVAENFCGGHTFGNLLSFSFLINNTCYIRKKAKLHMKMIPTGPNITSTEIVMQGNLFVSW